MALPCILLVDDNKTRSQQLEIILRFMEYQVETVDSSNYISSLPSANLISCLVFL